MRILALALLLSFGLRADDHHFRIANTGTSFKSDKQFHFVIGYVAANFGWAIARDWGWKHPELYGVALALLASLWKEHQDWKRAGGVADGMDIAYTLAGGGLVTLYEVRW